LLVKEKDLMKNILVVLLFLVLSSCAQTSKSDVKSANYHYQLGISYLNDNNIQPAFVELQKALELNPHDRDTQQALGIIYLTTLEDYPKAIKHFQQALQIDPDFSEAANNLGNAYASIGKFDEAIDAYKMAVANPQYQNAANAFFNLGMAYYRIAEHEEAIDAFTRSLRRVSDFPMPYYGLALTYNAKGLYGEAATALDRALQLDPQYKGDREKASEDLKNRKITAKGVGEKDVLDYLEILKY
jgi:type IV pilus assembly protein PilF